MSVTMERLDSLLRLARRHAPFVETAKPDPQLIYHDAHTRVYVASTTLTGRSEAALHEVCDLRTAILVDAVEILELAKAGLLAKQVAEMNAAPVRRVPSSWPPLPPRTPQPPILSARIRAWWESLWRTR